MKNIVIYGAGKNGMRISDIALKNGIETKGWIDKDKSKSQVSGKQIYSFDQITNFEDCEIVISPVEHTAEIMDELIDKGISKEKLIPYWKFVIDCELARYEKYKNVKMGSTQNFSQKIYICLPEGFVLGGAEAFCEYLLERLLLMGYEAYVICFPGENEIPIHLQDNVIIFQKGSYQENIDRAFNFFSSIDKGTIITNFFEELAIGAYMAQNINSDIKVEAVVHCGSQEHYEKNIFIKSYVDHYIVVSKEIGDSLRQGGIEAAKVMPVDFPVICPKGIERKYAKNVMAPIRIAYAGRLVEIHKRLDLQLMLISVLEERHINYQYTFLGEGDYKDTIRKYITENGLQEKVKIQKALPRKDILQFWNEQDICVNTSDREGRCISVMEGMAGGAVPVMTSTVGAVQNISDGINGYIVNLRDVATIADKIIYLYENRNMIEAMGKKAHDSIYQKNDIRKFDELWGILLQ